MCGIVGVVNEKRQAGSDIFISETSLQHRGKESAGIAVDDGECGISCHVGKGETLSAFAGKSANSLPGRIGVGQVRYSNTGSSTLKNAQPVLDCYQNEKFALVHNGQLTNKRELESECARYGQRLDGDCTDTAVVARLIAQSQAPTFADALLEVLSKLRGSFCFIALHQRTLYAIRDRYGVHPLQLGMRGNDIIVASESCGIDHLSIEEDGQEKMAHVLREVQPGEMVTIRSDGSIDSLQWMEPAALKFDIFEYIYFLRPDSKVQGVVVELARRRMGYYLAEEHPRNGLVVPVSSSGNAAGFGYYLRAYELGYDVALEPQGLFKPNTAGRAWVLPYEDERKDYLRIKFNIVGDGELIRGRDVILVDDSIVRSITAERLVTLMRNAGARSVHVRSASPMYLWPDIYGNDTYKDYLEGSLIARELHGDVGAIMRSIGADSLGYLSLEKTKRAILDVAEPGSPLTMDSFHDAVFTGEYALGKGDFEIS